MDTTLVRCPIGHGLFMVPDPGPVATCPACGVSLLAVLDDFVAVIPATRPSPDRPASPVRPLPTPRRPTPIAIPA